MFGKNDHIERLKAVPLFSNLAKKDLNAIAKATDEVTFPAGHALITEGEMGNEAFVVLAGSVTVTRNGKRVASLGPGDVIGEYTILEHAPRVASVTCDDDCTMLVIDRRHFSALLESTPALAIKFLQELAGRLRELDRTAFG